MRYIVVGAGHAGGFAVAALRQGGFEGEIILSECRHGKPSRVAGANHDVAHRFLPAVARRVLYAPCLHRP